VCYSSRFLAVPVMKSWLFCLKLSLPSAKLTHRQCKCKRRGAVPLQKSILKDTPFWAESLLNILTLWTIIFTAK
jgi:hypothetical protein